MMMMMMIKAKTTALFLSLLLTKVSEAAAANKEKKKVTNGHLRRPVGPPSLVGLWFCGPIGGLGCCAVCFSSYT
jgi:hypothetical protein